MASLETLFLSGALSTGEDTPEEGDERGADEGSSAELDFLPPNGKSQVAESPSSRPPPIRHQGHPAVARKKKPPAAANPSSSSTAGRRKKKLDVIVIGAGFNGLACAACLQEQGLTVAVIDREAAVGDPWRARYDRLHVHNLTDANALPFVPFPTNAAGFLGKNDFARRVTSLPSLFPLSAFCFCVLGCDSLCVLFFSL